MSGRHPPLTTDRRLGPGPAIRRGRSATYRAIEIVAGEPHLLRDDLGTGALEPATASWKSIKPTRPMPCRSGIHIRFWA